MKKVITIILIFVMLASTCTIGIFADTGVQPQISVMLNSQLLEFDVPPQLINDRTLVPMRAIFEALGATIDWDEENQCVIAKKDSKTIKLIIGNTAATVNGENYDLDVAPIIFDDRTLVPLRFVAEMLNCEVKWDEPSQTVYITFIIPSIAPTATPKPTPTAIPTPVPSTVTDLNFYDDDNIIPAADQLGPKYVDKQLVEKNTNGSATYQYTYILYNINNYSPSVQFNAFKTFQDYIALLDKSGFSLDDTNTPNTFVYSKSAGKKVYSVKVWISMDSSKMIVFATFS